MEYEDFELELCSRGEHRYEVKLHSPVGPAKRFFELPFKDGTPEQFFLRIGQRTDVRDMGEAETEFIKNYGGQLFDAVFSGEILNHWRQSHHSCKQRNMGLRVRLRMNDATGLQDYPWEYLYDGTNFISPISNIAIVRSLEVPESHAAQLSGPLRILVVAAKPRGLPMLDIDREWNVINNSLDPLIKKDAIVVKRLLNPTLLALQTELDLLDYHVFHFIGHGYVDPSSGKAFLAFENESGDLDRVLAEKLGNLAVAKPSLRVAVLNSCQGGSRSNASPLSGVAQHLIHSGIAAVVAMLSKISDNSAILFSRAFYEALAGGVTIDEAVARARRSIFAADDGSEWGTPVLYVGGKIGSLFRLVRQEKPYIWSKTVDESIDEIFECGSDLVVRSASKILMMLRDSEELVSRKFKNDRTPSICAASPDPETSKIWVVSSDQPLAPSAIRVKRIEYPSGEEVTIQANLPQLPLAISCWPNQQNVFIVFASGYARIEEPRHPILSVTKWNYEAAIAAFNRDFLATISSGDQQLRIYSLDLQEKQWPLTKASDVHLMALAETNGVICLADQNHVLNILHLDESSQKREISQRHWITAVALNQDGSYLAFATADPGRSVFLCNLKTRNSSPQCIGKSDSLIMCLTFSAQKFRLYSGSATGEVRAWSLDVELN